MTTYVAGDVRAIQEYVFGSPRLLEMRGASALVDAFDRGVVPRLVADGEGDLAFSGGGNFLARWEGGSGAAERARRFEEAVRTEFLELTGSEGLTVVRIETDEPFERAQAKVRATLAARKRAPDSLRQLASMPFLKRCESCGREAADFYRRAPGAGERRRWIGPMCERKRRMLGKLRRLAKASAQSAEGAAKPRLRIPLLGQRIEVPQLSGRLLRQDTPKDFETLTEGDDLAVVVADGNGLGAWFEAVASWEQYRELSSQVQESLRTALEGALDLFPRERFLPIQVLIAGGDDLVVALPARHGLAFAQAIVEGFRVEWGGEERGMAAGVLLAGPRFPFRQAHALAEELLGRAKRRCREAGARAALDFHRVKGTHVQSLRRELALLRRGPQGGPAWSYGGSGPFLPEELRNLLGLAARLTERSTPTQRGVLREILSPRDDGPHTVLDPRLQIPARVVTELRAWLARQEADEPPFPADEDSLRELVPTVSEPGEDGPVTVAHLRLADALLLADLGVEAPRS